MSEGGHGPFCDVCGREFYYRRQYATLPEDICSVSCLDKRQAERERQDSIWRDEQLWEEPADEARVRDELYCGMAGRP